MKTFPKIFAAVVALFVLSVASAAVLNFSWTTATKNTDNTDIPASGAGSITSTIVTYGPCNAGRTALASVTGTVTAQGAATVATSPNLPPGEWCGFAQHVNTYGSTSDPSNVAFRTVAPPKPNPPSNFSLG